MAMTDMRCLYSTVKNTSGGAKPFGFLPPHGRKLAANEEFTVWGDIREAIIRFERTEARRSIIAFENALARGDIDIIHTPNPILQDHTTGHNKILRLNNGALGVVDPCWKFPASGSLSDVVPSAAR
jgi:hypothetical protein